MNSDANTTPAASKAAPQPDPERRSRPKSPLPALLLSAAAVAIGAALWLGLLEFGGDQTDPSGSAGVATSEQTENLPASRRSQIDGPIGGTGSIAGAPPSADAAALEYDRDRSGAAGGAALGEARREAEAALAELAPAGSAPGAAPPSASGGVVRPEFDVVRVPSDGSMVLAGRAAPGAEVEIRVDGKPSVKVKAEDSGEFVALIDAPNNPSREGGSRRLDLSAKNPDGTVLDSAAPVIVTLPSGPGEAPVALRPTKEKVEILQPPARESKEGVTIDAVTYGESGDVVVSGRGDPGQTARLYLDNSLQAEATVGDDGAWRAEITKEVKPARYNLRVDQTSTSGAVSSRAETPFERAAPSDIKISEGAVIVQPGNNLWRIATYVYGDGTRYTVIYGQNRTQIRDPDLIYPGQVLDLPKVDEVLQR